MQYTQLTRLRVERKRETGTMFRTLLSAAAAAALLAGCAAPKIVNDKDAVDTLIAQSAVNATAALRDLSETTGNSRVVSSTKQAPQAVQQPAPQAAQAAPQPTPAAAQQPSTIAGRSGAIAVEMPSSAMISSPSTGFVASGGLLSAPPAGLERLITVRWTGDLEQLIAKVAQEVGWNVAEYQGLRVAPVIISINAENRSAFDVLRDIGGIAGTSAEIRVSAVTRTISVRYPQH